MVRGRKPQKYSYCWHCGEVFKRWRCSAGNWTVARYCPRCQHRRQGAPANLALQVDVARARETNPCATLQKIGDGLGVSRERVRQILSQTQKPTSAYRQTYLCIQCGKDMGVEERLFCSRQCQCGYGRTQIACSYCGELKEYSIKHVVWAIENGRHSTDLFFCSKQCHGRWLGERCRRK